MAVPVLMMLASMLVPVAHESWAHEMDDITQLAGQPSLTRTGDLDQAAQMAARLGPRPDLRQQLRGQGLTDGLILPVVVISPGLPEIRDAWRAYVRQHILPQGVTHYGIALQGDTLAMVFARRLFTLDTIPEKPPAGRAVTISGTVARDLTELEALVGRPDELVSPATIERTGSKLSVRLPLDAGPGTYLLELIGRSERGPEVIAMVPVHSMGAERGPTTPCLEGDDRHSRAPAAQLIHLINRDRRRLGLTPLRRSETLARSARRHADHMADNGFAAHVLPGGRPPASRLAHFDIRTERFHENVAMATSVGQAHADLWASPSHRQALLDPSVNKIGVGVHTIETDGGPIHFVVQHLAKL